MLGVGVSGGEAGARHGRGSAGGAQRRALEVCDVVAREFSAQSFRIPDALHTENTLKVVKTSLKAVAISFSSLRGSCVHSGFLPLWLRSLVCLVLPSFSADLWMKRA